MPARRATVALALALFAVGLARSAVAAPKGTIVVTAHEIDPKAPGFEKELKRAATTTIDKEGDAWNLFFIAYLKKPAGAEEVYLVFYEAAKGKREQVNAFPIATSAKAEILSSTVSIAPEQGFKSGHSYQVVLGRVVGGKEEVYARTNLTLK